MRKGLVGLTAAAMAVSAVAVAETTPEDAKDYREAVMTSLKGHILAASMHVRGLVDDNGFLGKHAAGLANGAQEIEHVFPEGSAVGDSEALPAIWENPEDFAAAIDEAEKATAEFATAVEGGDKATIATAFREVGSACKGCHDRFRLDDEND